MNIDINAIESVFRDNNLTINCKHPYFEINGLPGWDEFSFHIGSEKITIFRSDYRTTIISIDIDSTSSTKIATSIIEEIRNFIQFEEREKDILNFAYETLDNICKSIGNSWIFLWKIFHIVYKVDEVYQHRLQVIVANSQGHSTNSVVFDLTNKVVQICTTRRMKLDVLNWWKSDIEYQPDEIMYKLGLLEVMSNITPTNLAEILRNFIEHYCNYVSWIYKMSEVGQYDELCNTKGNKLFHELAKKLQLDRFSVFISDDVSPFIKSMMTICSNSDISADALFKIIISGKADRPSLIKDFRSEEVIIDKYEVTGLFNKDSVVDFINSYILGDKSELGNITSRISALLLDEDYYYFTRSFPQITAEVDYPTKTFKRIKCSQYISLSEKVDFILEITSKGDNLYYSILNSVKGDIVDIPITNLLDLTSILKGYVLGSYKNLPVRALEIFEDCEDELD